MTAPAATPWRNDFGVAHVKRWFAGQNAHDGIDGDDRQHGVAFDRVAEHVRRQNGIRQFAQRTVRRQRFDRERIEGDTHFGPLARQIGQSGFVDDAAARGIHQDGIGFHQAQAGRVQQSSGAGIQAQQHAGNVAVT